MRRALRGGVLAAVGALVLALLPGAPASAGPYDSSGPTPPGRASTTQQGEGTCSMYGSAAGFGVVCSSASGGKTLAELLEEGGVVFDPAGEFCWDDPDLPEGFQPDPGGPPGPYYLHTCLSFPTKDVRRSTAQVSYEPRPAPSGGPTTLTQEQEQVISYVLGRGQIPFLQLQATPVRSPRVGSDMAFGVVCDMSRLAVCEERTKVHGGQPVQQLVVETPRLRVGEITMWAELVHIRVNPEGPGPDGSEGKRVDCYGGGLPRTAEQLDAVTRTLGGVCRFRYDRSSNGRGGGLSGDRWPARLTAYWTVFYSSPAGDGALADGRAYEKRSTHQVRVTEVQTLVVG